MQSIALLLVSPAGGLVPGAKAVPKAPRAGGTLLRAAGALQLVDDTSFAAAVLGAKAPVLVDFYGDWCGPCRAIEPHLQRLAETRSSAVSVVKAKLDDCPDVRVLLLAEHGTKIKALPTCVLFDEGKPIGTLRGAFDYGGLQRFLEAPAPAPADAGGATVAASRPLELLKQRSKPKGSAAGRTGAIVASALPVALIGCMAAARVALCV